MNYRSALPPCWCRTSRDACSTIRDELGIAILLVEQSAAAALDIADYAYVLENGRIVLDGDRERLKSHQDVQEFYLGQSRGETPLLS